MLWREPETMTMTVDFSHKHYGAKNLHFKFLTRHQTKRIPAADEFNFHIHFVQQVTILTEHVVRLEPAENRAMNTKPR